MTKLFAKKNGLAMNFNLKALLTLIAFLLYGWCAPAAAQMTKVAIGYSGISRFTSTIARGVLPAC